MRFRLLGLAVSLALPGCGQPTTVPGAPLARRPAPYPCEGCEITWRAEATTLRATVVVAGPDEPGDRLVISGRVMTPDGARPAPGVVLYVHQTDSAGIYRQADGGHALQGWLVSDAEGRYRIETVRPGPYPSGGMPAHIHVYVGEPGREAYYLNDIVFEGDPEVTPAYLDGLVDASDDGVVRLVRDGDGWRGERDLVLVP